MPARAGLKTSLPERGAQAQLQRPVVQRLGVLDVVQEEGGHRALLAHAPLRMADVGQTEFQLVIDVRRFRVAVDAKPTAEIALSAKIVDKNGNVVAARLFEESEKFDQLVPPQAAAAFSDAFGRIAKSMIAWTVEAP